jgi:hypothetical protein
MKIGLVNCSSKKLSVRAPAFLLYSLSPRFTQQYKYLAKRTDKVYIVSAKLGLLDPLEIIEPYDTYLGDLGESEINELKEKIAERFNKIKVESAISLLSSRYIELLPELPNLEVIKGSMFELAERLGSQGTLRPEWPLDSVIHYIFERSICKVEELRDELKGWGFENKKIIEQVAKIDNCILLKKQGNFIKYLF